MKEFVKGSYEKLRLLLIWITRILLAKPHFKIPVWKKLALNLQGYLVDQYVIYDFKHNKKSEYLSEFDWYRSRRINGEYNFILNNKVVCSDMLKQYTRVPELYAAKIGGKLVMENGAEASYEDVLAFLKHKEVSIMKPISCGKGKDVCRIEFCKGSFLVNQVPQSDGEFKRMLQERKDWFVSEFVHQASYLNRIYDEAANTLRIITLRAPDTNRFKIFFAVQRIGTQATFPVDNGSRGGLIAKVDLDSGRLSEARSLHNLNVYEVHPDTGCPIKGTVIPGWSRLKEEILELANHFSYLNFVAWDILVTEEGFCVIEANTSSGVNIIQLWGGQRQGELGQFYRHYHIIK